MQIQFPDLLNALYKIMADTHSSFKTELRASIHVKFFNPAVANNIFDQAWGAYTRTRSETGNEAAAKAAAKAKRDELLGAHLDDQVGLPPRPHLPAGWKDHPKFKRSVNNLSHYAHRFGSLEEFVQVRESYFDMVRQILNEGGSKNEIDAAIERKNREVKTQYGVQVVEGLESLNASNERRKANQRVLAQGGTREEALAAGRAASLEYRRAKAGGVAVPASRPEGAPPPPYVPQPTPPDHPPHTTPPH